MSAQREVVIFGAGQIAEVVHHYLTHEGGRRVAAFTVDGDRLDADCFCAAPVVAFETVQDAFPPDRFDIFVALSYRGMNAPRAAKLGQARAKGYTALGHVSPRAAVPPGFVARPNTFVMEHNTLQPFATVGENVMLWSGNHIGHHSRIGDNVFISSHVVISGGVEVGDNSFIGVNATLRDNIRIGARCLVGAGAIVLSDTEDGSVYPGKATEPARVRSDRVRL